MIVIGLFKFFIIILIIITFFWVNSSLPIKLIINADVLPKKNLGLGFGFGVWILGIIFGFWVWILGLGLKI